MRMQSLLNRALFGKRKGDLKDYTNGLKETFAQEKKAKKVLMPSSSVIENIRQYPFGSRNIGEDRTESEEKATLESKSGLFLILGLVTSVAR